MALHVRDSEAVDPVNSKGFSRTPNGGERYICTFIEPSKTEKAEAKACLQ